MLRFNEDWPNKCGPITTISIHQMLRFNQQIDYIRQINKNFNTSNVKVQRIDAKRPLADNTNFNTSNVKVQQKTGNTPAQAKKNFNTSNVKVQLLQDHLYQLSFEISIHQMLRFNKITVCPNC